MQNYTTDKGHCQDTFQTVANDIIKGSRAYLLLDTEKRKIISEELSQIYAALGNNRKADYVSHCSDFLTIGTNAEGKSKVLKAYRCNDRLCPICQKVRSSKTYSILRQAIDESEKNGDYHYIFLTLTVKNIEGSILRDAVKGMIKAFDSMRKTTRFQRAIGGSIRSLEITNNKETQEWHPHLHIILQVKKQYFYRSSKLYITQDQYLAMWKKALAKYTTLQSEVVDIRRTKKDEIAIELCKYVSKSNDYIDIENPSHSADRVAVLSTAIHGIRFTGMSGNIKKVPVSTEEHNRHIAEYNQNLLTYQFNRSILQYVPYRTR